MLKTVEGVYRDGKIELLEPAPQQQDGRVMVTFLSSYPSIDLASRGMDETQAASLRSRLKTFAEDWDQPEMDVYDRD